MSTFFVILLILIGIGWLSGIKDAQDKRKQSDGNADSDGAIQHMGDVVVGAAIFSRSIISSIEEIDDFISRAREVQQATASVSRDVAKEKAVIEAALKTARLKFEINESCKDPEYAKLYKAALERIDGNVFKTDRKIDNNLVDIDFIPDFSFFPGKNQEGLDEEISLKIENIKNDRDKYIKNVINEICKNPNFEELFWNEIKKFNCNSIIENLKLIRNNKFEINSLKNHDKSIDFNYDSYQEDVFLESPFEVFPVLDRDSDIRIDSKEEEITVFAGHSAHWTKKGIRTIAEKKCIPFLVHFTRIENLASIMQYGLCSVSTMQKKRIVFRWNDGHRLDGHEDAISLSISHPNEKLFYRWRKSNPEQLWVVLLIDISVLWEMDTKFCPHNAADSRIVQRKVNSGPLMTDFEGMFAAHEGVPSREEQHLRIFEPTDVQAEVLIFGNIAPEKIVGVVFNDRNLLERWSSQLGNRDIKYINGDTGLFGLRAKAKKK